MAKVANTKVKASRRVARKGKRKKTAMMGPMFGKTWGEALEILLANALRGRRSTHQSGSPTRYPSSCKNTFLQRQVRTAIRKRSNWGDVLKKLSQMYPV